MEKMYNGKILIGLIPSIGWMMKTRVRIFVLTGMVSMLAAGCATAPAEQSALTEEQQMISVLQRISDSTAMAVNAQQELALTADAKVQGEMAQRRRLLTDVVTYDFYGNVEDILKEISLKYGYEFKTYGKRPPEGVNANVFVAKKPVLEILKQIGYTSTSALDVVVTRQEIQLHYKGK